jgi:hypothetical protein
MTRSRPSDLALLERSKQAPPIVPPSTAPAMVPPPQAPQQLAYTAAQAAALLGYDDPEWVRSAPIPWVDLRKPGSNRASPRWLHTDLVAWLETRRVQPGHPSPFEP